MVKKPSTYAEGTDVPVERSRAEIEKTLERYGADRFMWFTEPNRAVLIFEADKRRIRFDLPVPDGQDDAANRRRRERWRALLLCIKARLQSVQTGIETFEEAFLSHVVMPDGRTVGDHALPRIASAYGSGEIQPLLPAPQNKE
jgi:hypothetical protein